MPNLSSNVTYNTLHLTFQDIVAEALDQYRPARESFSFDLQPSQESDRAYRITMARERTEHYIGTGQAELYRADVYLTRRINRNPMEAEADLRVDLITLEDSILFAGVAADYNVADDSVTADVQSPAADAEYVVGRLSMVLDVERDTV